MKRVLIVTKQVPYPPHINGNVNSLFNLVKCDYMSRYEIDLLYFENDVSQNEPIFNDYIKRFIRIPAMTREITLGINGRIIIKPFGIWSISSKRFKQFDASEYDIIVYGSMIEACIIGKVINNHANTIIFAADSPILFYSTKMQKDRKIYKKIHYFIQSRLYKTYEKNIIHKVNRLVYVSDKDAEIERDYLENIDVKTARLGVSTCAEKTNHKKTGILEIGFSGIMTYSPNHEAVEYILNEIMPLLDKKNILYRIHIIGKNPDPQWHRFTEKNNIVITGYIENIDKYISEMDIYISPLFKGSGMKNKILQALSIGTPIIASQVSVDGINGMIDGYNYALCNENPENWANTIETLFNNFEKRVEYSKRGKELIKQDYSWERFARDLIE